MNNFNVITVTVNPAIDRTLTIPRFRAGTVNRVEAVVESAGGKGVNVAAGLADFGVRVAATGFLGKENAGIFDEFLERKAIANRFVRIAGGTRVGIKISDPLQQQTTDINFPGLSPKSADIAALRRQLLQLAKKPCWFVLAGSLPPQVSPKFYGDLVAELRRRGHKVVLDATGEPLRHGIAAHPTVVKPNIDELNGLVGKQLKSERAVVRAARKLVSGGTELVVVSLGHRGALFVSAQEAVIARPPEVAVISTVGAGDAMVAGIVAAQLRGVSLAEDARLATAFSLERITKAQEARYSPATIKKSMSLVRIESVNL